MSKPFVYGTAVFGENFTDRKEETRRLKLNFEAGVNTILISPRRTGKTSLVYKAVEQIEDPSIKVVMMDIYDCRDEYEFYERFASAIIKGLASKAEQAIALAKSFLSRLSPKISISPDTSQEYSLSLGIGPKTEKPEEILNLPEIIAQKRNINIVVCIDEFQQVGEFQDSIWFQKKARGVWQLQKNVSYCLFGSKKHMMEKLFQDKSMPFYQFGDSFFLGPISKDAWVNYIVQRFATKGMTISEEMAGRLCDRVQLHSSYVQQLAWNVMIETESDVTEETLESGYELLLRQTSALFMRQLENLTVYQMNYLKALDAGVHTGFQSSNILEEYRMGSKSNITRIENILLNKELIDKRLDGIYFADPVFAYWFHREYCL
ncbi:MAG: ATP-binding protein [Candidatus Cryptobacteroides sp.]